MTEDIVIYPSLTDRIKSTMTDLLFILFLSSIIALALNNINVPDWVRALLFISLLFIYEPVAQTLGCTLGNYIMGIRTRQSTNHSKGINIAQAYIRFIIKSLLGWVSFFTIYSNKKRRAIHDMAANSVVIYA